MVQRVRAAVILWQDWTPELRRNLHLLNLQGEGLAEMLAMLIDDGSRTRRVVLCKRLPPPSRDDSETGIGHRNCLPSLDDCSKRLSHQGELRSYFGDEI